MFPLQFLDAKCYAMHRWRWLVILTLLRTDENVRIMQYLRLISSLICRKADVYSLDLVVCLIFYIFSIAIVH
jgi:hypothetical protein